MQLESVRSRTWYWNTYVRRIRVQRKTIICCWMLSVIMQIRSKQTTIFPKLLTILVKTHVPYLWVGWPRCNGEVKRWIQDFIPGRHLVTKRKQSIAKSHDVHSTVLLFQSALWLESFQKEFEGCHAHLGLFNENGELRFFCRVPAFLRWPLKATKLVLFQRLLAGWLC